MSLKVVFTKKYLVRRWQTAGSNYLAQGDF